MIEEKESEIRSLNTHWEHLNTMYLVSDRLHVTAEGCVQGHFPTSLPPKHLSVKQRLQELASLQS